MKKTVLIATLLVINMASICGQTSFLGVKVNQPFESAVAEMKKIAKFDYYSTFDRYSAEFKYRLYGRPVELSVERADNGEDVYCIYACFELGMTDKKFLQQLISEYSKKYGKYKKSYDPDFSSGVLYTWQTFDAEVDISCLLGICIQYYPKN